jgi:hypothetical protein
MWCNQLAARETPINTNRMAEAQTSLNLSHLKGELRRQHDDVELDVGGCALC